MCSVADVVIVQEPSFAPVGAVQWNREKPRPDWSGRAANSAQPSGVRSDPM
jgi:hypothetical protein